MPRSRSKYADPPRKVTRSMVMAHLSRLKPGDLVVRGHLFKTKHHDSIFGVYWCPVVFSCPGHARRERRKLNKILDDLVKSGVLSRYDGSWTKKAKHVVRRVPVETDW